MKTFLSFLLVALALSLQSQHKFGKVELSQFDRTAHLLDSSAHSAYIFHEGDVSFEYVDGMGFSMYIEYHDLIQIFKEEGKEMANVVIDLHKGRSEKETVSKIKAAAYNLVNGKIESTELRKQDIYEEKISDNHEQIKFAVPNVRAGSIVEISYSLRSPYIYVIPTWFFQSHVPIDQVSYSLKLPKFFTYTPIPKGFVELRREDKWMNSAWGEVRGTILTGKNVPPIKDEEYVLNMNDYTSSLKYELFSVAMPGKPTKNYSKNWVQIGDDLLEETSFGKEITRRLKDLDPILEQTNAMTKEQKMAFLYSYVQNNYSWNGNYGRQTDDGLKSLLSTKSGNISEINLLLLNLLNKAEINAYPFLVRSRYAGLLNPSYPSLTSLNYVMVYVEAEDGRVLLLDASSKYVPIGQLPKRAININGLLVKKNASDMVSFSNMNKYNVSGIAQYTLTPENVSLIGTGKKKYADYAATRYRIKADEKEDAEDIKEEYAGDTSEEEEEEELRLSNTFTAKKIEGFEDINSAITLEYDEEIFTHLQKIGNKYFIDCALDFGVNYNPFTEDKREFPVFYDQLLNLRQSVSIILPEGYAVESLPESLFLSLPDDQGKYMYEVKQMANKLIISYKFQLNQDVFSPESYFDLKQFYNLIIQKEKEKIVVVKS